MASQILVLENSFADIGGPSRNEGDENTVELKVTPTLPTTRIGESKYDVVYVDVELAQPDKKASEAQIRKQTGSEEVRWYSSKATATDVAIVFGGVALAAYGITSLIRRHLNENPIQKPNSDGSDTSADK